MPDIHVEKLQKSKRGPQNPKSQTPNPKLGLIFALKRAQEVKRSHAKLIEGLEAARRLAFEACSEISIVLQVTWRV